MKQIAWPRLGVVGTIICIALFIRSPSFPTPDKLFVFLTFVFMMFGQAKDLFKRLLPFVGLLLVYGSFVGLVPHLNSRVNYTWMPSMDKRLFGNLPTAILQNWWWHGHVHWYDILLYIPYLLHFVIPIGLALLIWRYKDKFYWRFVTTFLVVSFMGFATYLAFPAAPPWMATQKGYIQHVDRISTSVWYDLGLKNFPTFYNKVSPNPVAAVPSLHAAYATLIFVFVCRIFGKKWGVLAALHPILIYIGTVYEGEHYAIDIILGIFYALIAYFLTAFILRKWLPKN